MHADLIGIWSLLELYCFMVCLLGPNVSTSLICRCFSGRVSICLLAQQQSSGKTQKALWVQLLHPIQCPLPGRKKYEFMAFVIRWGIGKSPFKRREPSGN